MRRATSLSEALQGLG